MGYPRIAQTGTGTGLEQPRDDQQPILTTSPVPRVIRERSSSALGAVAEGDAIGTRPASEQRLRASAGELGVLGGCAERDRTSPRPPLHGRTCRVPAVGESERIQRVLILDLRLA